MKPDGSTGVNIKAPAGAKRSMRRGTGCDCGCVSEAASVGRIIMYLSSFPEARREAEEKGRGN